MSRSPGHRKWPYHQVREERVEGRLTAEVEREVVADSEGALRVVEDDAPVRHYFPRADVRMELLEPTLETTECPFKGTARYFTLNAGGRSLRGAAWSYEDPYEEHAALKDRIAFYDECPEIALRIPG